MDKVIFHVVNSIKGGCGKSTFSLLLADYYRTEYLKTHPNGAQNVFIIDLDWHGSSWQKNFESYFEESDSKYINKLMFDFEEKSKTGIYHSIKYRHIDEDGNPLNDNYISVCMADTEEIIFNEVEQDLYENTIYNVIKKTIEYSNCDGTLHIILDMPPSNETYSDKVLNHLLLDQKSSLYKAFESGKLKTKKYDVNLYMISALSIAHIELNLKFIKRFFRNYSYSSVLPKLNHEERLNVFFIVNDPNHVVNEDNDILNGDIVKSRIENELASFYSAYRCLNIGVFPFLRMNFQADVLTWLSSGNVAMNELGIDMYVYSRFSELIVNLSAKNNTSDETEATETFEYDDAVQKSEKA